MPELDELLTELASVASRCVASARVGATRSGDDALLEYQRRIAASARLIDITASTLAAEIAHRSRRELGYLGLAQKHGARSPEALVQSVTGSSGQTARRLIRVGTMVAEMSTHDSDPTFLVAEPWLEVAVAAAAAGQISSEALEVIRCGVGVPCGDPGAPTEGDVTAEALAVAVGMLTAMAADVTLDRLAACAREQRDHLDAAGVSARENERRGRRYLRLFPQSDGMTKIVGLLDPESAAVVVAAVDAATSPRRGGPRFVDPTDVLRAESIVSDPRSTEQLALDAVVEMIDVAVRSRTGNRLPERRAVVRVLVTQRDLAANTGVGFIEGQTASISISSVQRLACDGGLQPILFDDDGQSLNLGRTQRLHNSRQRAVISARDGGCIATGCDRPPSWSEVHHITDFSRGGLTDVVDGVCLCRHHHMLVHNNEWRITRTGGRYWLVPPLDVDPQQRPRKLESASPALRRLLVTA
ncbi:MAG: DUF222 domain-containing protein [Rhodoglobus sp.]